MQSIQEDMNELRMQLGTGAIRKAYRALLDYMMDLRTRFKNRFPNYSVSGLYQGYMDMTYFAIIPPSLKHRNLKIAIVFNYLKLTFVAAKPPPSHVFYRGRPDGGRFGLYAWRRVCGSMRAAEECGEYC